MRSAASAHDRFDRDPPSATTPRILTWAAIIMVLLSLPLMVNFVSRVQAEVRMSDEEQRRAAQVQRSEQILTQLHEAVQYAQSDAFTERYAREQARYVKPGEVVVVPPGVQDAAKPHKAWWEDFVTLGSAPTSMPANAEIPAATAQPSDNNR